MFALTAAQTALAATDIYWQGGNGSETNPVNIYSKSSWTGSNTYSGSGISMFPCNAHNLRFGFAADAEDTTAWLKCDGTTDSTAIANLFVTHSGHFIFTSGSFRTISNFSVGRLSGDNSTVTKKDGDWTIGGDLNIGYVADSTGIVEVVGGSISVSKTQYIGYSGNGTLTINGGTVEVASGYNTNPGWNSGSSGTINLNGGVLKTKRIAHNNGSGRLNFNGGTLQANAASGDSSLIKNGITVTVGDGGGTIDNGGYNITMGKLLGDVDGTGPLHLTGAGTTTLGNTLIKNGTIVVDGGTVSASALHIGEDTGNDGYVEVNGGTLSVPNDIYMGYGNNSTAALTINGGTLSVPSGNIYVGFADNSAGTLTINDGTVEVDSSKQLLSAYGSDSRGTINLNGGVLKTKRIAYQYANSTCTVNFNGGTLQANADSNTDFIKSGTTVNVSAGGTIDNGGFAIKIPAALNGSGSLTFRGAGTTTLSGSVSSYSGATRVVAGSTLCVSKDIATKLLSNGLVLAGVPELDTPYTILTSSSANDDWTSLSLSKVTCPIASAISTKIGDDGKSIVVTVTELKSGNVWTGAKNSNMSDDDNWLEGVVPGAGADIDLSAATIVHADLDCTFGKVTMGAGVVSFTGKMKAKSFSDTSKIAVCANSTVTVDGDLEFGTKVASWVCSDVAEGGKFVVTGKIIAMPAQTGNLYAHHGTALGWVSAKGLVNNAAGDNFILVQSTGDYSANWLIGEDGISGMRRFVAGHSNGGTATIKATADFSVSADIVQYHNLTLEPNGHVITLGTNVTMHAGGILGGGAKGLTTVKGPGKVVANYNVANLTSYTDSRKNAFAVADGGKLVIASGANPSISGDINGSLTVNDGATLVLGATGSRFVLLTHTLNLPTGEGEKATLRIDGVRLRSDDHVIATLGNNATTANVELDGKSEALDGRKATLRVDGGNLILNVEPNGFKVIIR